MALNVQSLGLDGSYAIFRVSGDSPGQQIQLSLDARQASQPEDFGKSSTDLGLQVNLNSQDAAGFVDADIDQLQRLGPNDELFVRIPVNLSSGRCPDTETVGFGLQASIPVAPSQPGGDQLTSINSRFLPISLVGDSGANSPNSTVIKEYVYDSALNVNGQVVDVKIEMVSQPPYGYHFDVPTNPERFEPTISFGDGASFQEVLFEMTFFEHLPGAGVGSQIKLKNFEITAVDIDGYETVSFNDFSRYVWAGSSNSALHVVQGQGQSDYVRFEGPGGSLDGIKFNDEYAVKVFYQQPVGRVRFGLGRSQSPGNDERMFSLAFSTLSAEFTNPVATTADSLVSDEISFEQTCLPPFVDLQGIEGQGSCLDASGDPLFVYQVYLSGVTQVEERFSFGLTRSWGAADGRLGDVVATGGGSALQVEGDRIVVPAGVSEFTVKVPVKKAQFTGEEELTLTILSEKEGPRLSYTEAFSDDCKSLAYVDIKSIEGQGSCEDKKGDPYFVYEVRLNGTTRIDERFSFGLTRSWGAVDGRLGDVEVTGSGVVLNAAGDEIFVPAGVSEFTVKVPVKAANFKGDEELTLTVIDEKGGKAVDTEVFDAECQKLAHVDVVGLEGKGSCEDKKGDPYFVYTVSLSEATRINERMVLDWQQSWSKAEGRLGDVEVTSSAGVLVVGGDQIVVPAGVSEFTVKVPVKAANFKGDEELTLTVIDEKGGKAVDTEVFDAECQKLAHVDVVGLEGKGSCEDKKGDPYFVYTVSLSEATRINERMVLDWQQSWSKAEGRLGDVEVTSSAGVLVVGGDQIVVPAGVSEFTVKVPVKAANFKGDEELTLTVIDEKGGKAVDTEVFDAECQKLAHVDVVGLEGKGSCEDKKGDPYFVYTVSLSEATRINERMVLDWQQSWSKAEGRLGDVEVTSSAGVLVVGGDQIVVPAGVSEFTVKVPVKAANFKGDEELTLTVIDEKGGKAVDTEVFDAECQKLAHVDVVGLEGKGSCEDKKGDPYFVYTVSLSEATRINERMVLDWQQSWSKAEGRLGDVEVTSSAGVLVVGGDQIVVPAGVSEFTVKVPVKAANFKGDEELTLTVIDEKGGKAVDTEVFDAECQKLAHVDVVGLEGKGSCEDKKGDPYFVYTVSLSEATRINERMVLDWQQSWSKAEGRLGDVEVTSSAGVLVVGGDQIVVPAGVSEFTVKVPVKAANFKGDEELTLTVIDEKGGKAVDTEVFDAECQKLAHVDVVGLEGKGSCEDKKGDPYFVYTVSLSEATRINERMVLDWQQSWSKAEGRLGDVEVTSSAGVLVVGGDQIVVPAGVSEFTVKVPVKAANFKGDEELTLTVIDEKGGKAVDTEVFDAECQKLAHVDVVGLEGKGSCEDKKGDPYFVYTVSLSEATRINERMVLDWQQSWSKAEGRLGDVEVTSSAGVLVVGGDQIVVPAGVSEFTVKVPVKAANFKGDEELTLTVIDEKGGKAVDTEVFDAECQKLAHVDVVGLEGKGSCEDKKGDPYFVYTVSLSEATRINERMVLDWQQSWSKAEGRLGDVEVTSSAGVLVVGGDQIVVPAGVSEFTVKVPVKAANFKGDEELTLTVIDEKGGKAVDTEVFDAECQKLAHVDVVGLEGKGSCEDKKGDPYFVYTVSLSEATRINERMVLDWQQSWSKAEGRLGDVEVTSSAGVLVVGGDQIVVPAGVSEFTVKVPVKAANFKGDEELTLTVIDEKGGKAVDTEVFDAECQKLAHVDVVGLEGKGSCEDKKGDPYFVYTVSLSEATRINERMVLDWQQSWSKAEGRLGDVEVTSSAGVLVVGGDQIVVPAGVSEFTVKVPVKAANFKGDEELTLTVIDEKGGKAVDTEVFDAECQKLAHVDVVGLEGKGSCEDKKGDPYFVYTVSLSEATRINERMVLDWQQSWSKAEGRLGDVEVTSSAGVLVVGGDQIVVPAGVSEFTVKVPVKAANFKGDEELTLTVIDEKGGKAVDTEVFDAECQKLAHVDVVGLEGKGSCEDKKGDPYFVYTVSLSEATRINERMVLDWQQSWSKAEGRLGDVEVTSSAGVLVVGGDQIVVPAGVSEFTVKVPVKAANFKGDEELTLTVIDEKGGKAVDTEVFDVECSRLAEVDLRQVVATGACLDAKDQSAFVYDVFFEEPLQHDQVVSYDLTAQLAQGAQSLDLASIEALAASGSLVVDSTQQSIIVPARTKQFTLRVPVDLTALEEGDQLGLVVRTAASEAKAIESFDSDCLPAVELRQPDVHLFLLMDQSTSMNNPDPLVELASTNTRIEAQDRLAFLAYENALQQAGYGFRKVGSNAFKRIGDIPLIDTRSNSSRSVAEVLKRYELADDPGDARTPGDVHVHLIKYGYIVDYEKLEITPTDLGSGLQVEQSILLTETPDQTYGDSLSKNQDWMQRGLPAPEARDLFKGTGQLASNLYSGTEMLGALHGLTDLLTGLSSTVDSADWVDIDLITDGRPERRAWWDARDGGAGVAIPLPAALGGAPITSSGLLYDDAGTPRIVPTAAGVDQWTQTQTALNQALDQLAQQLDHPQTHLLVEAIGLGANDRVNFPAIYSDLFSNRTFDNSGSSWSYDVVASDTLPLVTG